MLNNKMIHRSYLLLILLLVVVLTACQAEQPAEEVCPIDISSGEITEDCLPDPAEENSKQAGYPVEEMIIVMGDESAYPITEADLSLLFKTWRLTAYAEGGVEANPPLRYLTFSDDGSYVKVTETGTVTGDWTTVLLAAESSLILDPGTDQEVQYQMIDLGETELNLRTWQADVQIDEGYEPDNAACVCD